MLYMRMMKKRNTYKNSQAVDEDEQLTENVYGSNHNLWLIATRVHDDITVMSSCTLDNKCIKT